MILWVFLIILLLSVGFYSFYTNFSVQFYIHRKKIKKAFLSELIENVKGNYIENGYFAASHRIIPKEQYNTFTTRQKIHFSKCYNIITFKTEDANIEFFFYLVRDGFKYSEMMSMRMFPNHNRIRSEGNVEKVYSKINSYANNRYLAEILDNNEMLDYFSKLIRKNGDILLISHNNIHYKAFLNSNKLSVKRVMNIIKLMYLIKNKIYKENILEY